MGKATKLYQSMMYIFYGVNKNIKKRKVIASETNWCNSEGRIVSMFQIESIIKLAITPYTAV